MGCYQEGIAKDSVGGKDVTAHIFEYVYPISFHCCNLHFFPRYTSSVIVTESGEVSTGSCPVQILFCLKEQNKKKLNSHRWFFNAFGPLIKPNGEFMLSAFTVDYTPWPCPSVCVLLDVGTKPTGTSIYELWKCSLKLFHKTMDDTDYNP